MLHRNGAWSIINYSQGIIKKLYTTLSITVFYLNLVNNKLLQLNHLSGQNDILESFAQNYLSN